jgi:hypothetical protein
MKKKPTPIEFFDCQLCNLPYPSTGKFELRKLEVCANCYVQNKRMFREW